MLSLSHILNHNRVLWIRQFTTPHDMSPPDRSGFPCFPLIHPYLLKVREATADESVPHTWANPDSVLGIHGVVAEKRMAFLGGGGS